MTKRITRIAPHRTALTLALVFAGMTALLFIPMIAMMGTIDPIDEQGNPMPLPFNLGFLLLLPLLYFVVFYIFTALMAWLYNQISRLTGGITYETDEAA